MALDARSPAGHAAAVAACRERIAAGDLFQANLCLRLDGRLRRRAARPLRRRRRARCARAAPPSSGAVAARVASLSPELFLAPRADASCAASRSRAPGRGRRPGGRRRERAALAASAKDRAENVMIVDLVRNDLGRVCEPGSVRVPALAAVRAARRRLAPRLRGRGRLRDGVGDADLLRAAFPPGSVTGAPKVAALDVIAELESTGREAYTGAIGFASPLAGLELNVAIRTFEMRGGRLWLGVGGGIVADSDPDAEAREAADEGGAAARRDRRGALAPAPPRAARRARRPASARARCRGPTRQRGRLRDDARPRRRAVAADAPPRPPRGERPRALRPSSCRPAPRARVRRRGRGGARRPGACASPPGRDRRRARGGRRGRRARRRTRRPARDDAPVA